MAAKKKSLSASIPLELHEELDEEQIRRYGKRIIGAQSEIVTDALNAYFSTNGGGSTGIPPDAAQQILTQWDQGIEAAKNKVPRMARPLVDIEKEIKKAVNALPTAARPYRLQDLIDLLRERGRI